MIADLNEAPQECMWAMRCSTHTQTYTHTCTHTYTRAHVHTYTRTHVHTYIHVHVKARSHAVARTIARRVCLQSSLVIVDGLLELLQLHVQLRTLQQRFGVTVVAIQRLRAVLNRSFQVAQLCVSRKPDTKGKGERGADMVAGARRNTCGWSGVRKERQRKRRRGEGHNNQMEWNSVDNVKGTHFPQCHGTVEVDFCAEQLPLARNLENLP